MQALILALLTTLVFAQNVPGPSPYTQAEKDTIVSQHNTQRSIYHVPNLVWNHNLSLVAAAYAANCTWEHNPNRKAQYNVISGTTDSVGENLFSNSGYGAAAGAINSWASEKADWNCTGNSCSGTCGHFTQMIWNASTAVGCARQFCSTGSPLNGFPTWTFVVCNYLKSQTSGRPTNYCPAPEEPAPQPEPEPTAEEPEPEPVPAGPPATEQKLEEIKQAFTDAEYRTEVTTFVAGLTPVGTVISYGTPETVASTVQWVITISYNAVLSDTDKTAIEASLRQQIATDLATDISKISVVLETILLKRSTLQSQAYEALVTVSGAASFVASALLSLVFLALFL